MVQAVLQHPRFKLEGTAAVPEGGIYTPTPTEYGGMGTAYNRGSSIMSNGIASLTLPSLKEPASVLSPPCDCQCAHTGI
jgi:hypothetical protein